MFETDVGPALALIPLLGFLELGVFKACAVNQILSKSIDFVVVVKFRGPLRISCVLLAKSCSSLGNFLWNALGLPCMQRRASHRQRTPNSKKIKVMDWKGISP